MWYCRCDVTKENDWEDLWNHAESELGKVGILVNNAGVNPTHGWRKCTDIMLTGVGIGTFLAIRRMGTSKGGAGGRIINIASVAGLFTKVLPQTFYHDAHASNIDGVGYVIAKHGVVALTRCFEDSSPTVSSSEGIKAYALCPYFADTQLVRSAINIDSLEQAGNARVLTVDEVLLPIGQVHTWTIFLLTKRSLMPLIIALNWTSMGLAMWSIRIVPFFEPPTRHQDSSLQWLALASS